MKWFTVKNLTSRKLKVTVANKREWQLEEEVIIKKY